MKEELKFLLLMQVMCTIIFAIIWVAFTLYGTHVPLKILPIGNGVMFLAFLLNKYVMVPLEEKFFK